LAILIPAGSGYQIQNATGINDNGQIVANRQHRHRPDLRPAAEPRLTIPLTGTKREVIVDGEPGVPDGRHTSRFVMKQSVAAPRDNRPSPCAQ
jgi:hypothetical protein